MRQSPAPDLLTEQEILQWTELFAREGGATEHTHAEELLLFELGGERFALRLAELDEVASVDNGAMLPNAPSLVAGLSNLRGELLLLIDLGQLLGVRAQPRIGTGNRTLILKDGVGHRCGLMVDAMLQVLSTEEADLRPFRGTAGDPRGELIEAVGEREGRALTLLDAGALLGDIRNHF